MTEKEIVALTSIAAIWFIGLIVREWWRRYNRQLDARDAIRRIASEAAAAAEVKYANEHPRELQAAIYGDGTAEDAANYRKGCRAVGQAAYDTALADPGETVAAAIWEASERKTWAEKQLRDKPPANESERAAAAAYLKGVEDELARLRRDAEIVRARRS